MPTFDDLAKSMAGARSRRQALRLLGAGTAAGLLGLFAPGAAHAGPRRAQACQKTADCGPAQRCCDGYCGNPYDASCKDPSESKGSCRSSTDCGPGQGCCKDSYGTRYCGNPFSADCG